MTAWNPEQLSRIETEPDLFVSPLRQDGTTFGTPTQTWAIVVDGKVYVRAASGPTSTQYQAAITQRVGRIHVADTVIDVAFEAAGNDDEAAIDAGYETKYPGSSAVPIMQGPEPRSAVVRIRPL